MHFRERSQFLLALFRQLQEHAPAIAVICDPPQQSELGDSIHQLDGGVMPNQKESGQIAHGNGLGAGKALDGEQRLVLLRRQAGLMGGRFAE
jgi:hypothetical protein